MKIKPQLALVPMAYPGYNLGEGMCDDKKIEMELYLKQNGFEILFSSECIYSQEDAKLKGYEINQINPDVIIVLLTTFVPDYFLSELLSDIDIPIFIWALEREIQCISMVGGVLVTGTLFNLNKNYKLVATDFPDEESLYQLKTFTNAAMIKSKLRKCRIGYSGGKNNIMLSMMADEYELKRRFGVSIINIPIEEFYNISSDIDDKYIGNEWRKIRSKVGEITVLEEDGLLSTRYYLALKELAKKYNLNGISINCFPYLKSKICLAIALINDEGIAAGCEGDLNSTLMMHILYLLSGKASFNGDILQLDYKENSILFSHCGAGAFSLSQSKEDIKLIKSIETCDGCAVCYPTDFKGKVSLLNLMTGEKGMRISFLAGKGQPSGLEYEGTPVKVAFKKHIKDILENISCNGAGHHWSGVEGNYFKEIELLCKFCDVEYKKMS